MKKIYSILFTALLISSCNVLDQVSPNDVAERDVFTSKEGAQSALVGLYNSLQARDYYGGYYPMIADLYSDEGIEGGFDNIALDEIGTLSVTPSNIFIENTWIAIYYTIATANAIVTNVGRINDPDFTSEEKDHIKGQALAIRGLAHFDLLRMFGEHWNQSSAYGIPVVKTVQSANDVVSRSSVAETYNAIISDLEAASALIIADDRSQVFINPIAVKAFLARLYLYKGDVVNAIAAADEVINDLTFTVLDENSFLSIYTSRFTQETIFELTFDVQNRSAFNSITYSRGDALRTEVLFLANEKLNEFFTNRPGDLRANLVDFVNNDSGISPDGRTQKYRGEETRDNPAYVIRISEVYLIRAEAYGLVQAGVDDLNMIRTNRGLSQLNSADFATPEDFLNTVLDERKAELNFEGHRMFDLARTGKVNDVLGIDDFRSIFPIPFREIIATKGLIEQNPGYE
jgi:starch-binding outer membrane protein, SusD/RagB family